MTSGAVSPGGPWDAPTGVPLACYRHPRRETAVRCTRCGRPICPDCMHDAPVGFQCPDCVADGHRTQRSPRTAYPALLRSAGQARVTQALVALNVLAFIVTSASEGHLDLGFSGAYSALFARFALLPLNVAHGQDYRLLTNAFLQFGLLHIAFNMYVLILLGPAVERALGRWRYLLLYLVAGLGASAASYAFLPVNTIAAGASGAIFGLFGAYYILSRRAGVPTRQVLAVIAINLVLDLIITGIDLQAHLGGLVTGTLVAAVFAYAPRRRRLAVQLLGVGLVAVAIVALVVVRGDSLLATYG